MSDDCKLVICRKLPDIPHHADTHAAARGDTMDCIDPRPAQGKCWQCNA